jgi:hypothetical protein
MRKAQWLELTLKNETRRLRSLHEALSYAYYRKTYEHAMVAMERAETAYSSLELFLRRRLGSYWRQNWA